MDNGNLIGQQAEQANVSLGSRNTTVAQNIDNRISQLEEQLERLKAVKQKLSTGSLLDASLADLQAALGRY